MCRITTFLVVVGLVGLPDASAVAQVPCTPTVVGPDGTFLGTLSANQYETTSVANPFGPYGSPYSPTSINNPYGLYSLRNPSSVNAPRIVNPCTGQLLGTLSSSPGAGLSVLPSLPLPTVIDTSIYSGLGQGVKINTPAENARIVAESKLRVIEAERGAVELEVLQELLASMRRQGAAVSPVNPPIDTPVDPEPELSSNPPAACASDGFGFASKVSPKADGTGAWVNPRRLREPVATLRRGVTLAVDHRMDDYLLVRFDDGLSGERTAYVRCVDVVTGR